jgi:cytochrome P450
LARSITRRICRKLGLHCEHLLDAAAQKPEIDLVNEYALPLAASALHELIGVPDGDRREVQEHIQSLPPASVRRETAREIPECRNWLIDYFASLSKLGVLFPGRGSRGNDNISHEEAGEIATKLFVAGYEPTANLLASSLLWAGSQPGLLASIAQSTGDDWFTELARFDSPVFPGVFRYATCDLTLAGRSIASGDTVIIAVAAAGRDACRFDDPNHIDLSRRNADNLSFGRGLHRCPGEFVASSTVVLGIRTFAQRYPMAALPSSAKPPVWSNRCVRALVSLPFFHQEVA